MNTNNFSVEQKLLENRHLKQRKDLSSAELAALYALQNQHKLERNQFRFDRVPDSQVWSDLLSRQQETLSELKQKQIETRLKLETQHHQERENLKQRYWEFELFS